MRETVYTLPDTIGDDLDAFKAKVEQFKSGSISAAQFRAFRVPQGVYEQREDGTFMLRIRLPAGCVSPHQALAIARVSRQYGDAVLHVTTRQDIQVHRVLLEGIHPALVELYGAGLSTKGGGGNTLRNVTACCSAGVCPQEAFDVTPHVIALTEFMLSDPLTYQLPRKYKIAFSGCKADCAGTRVNDLGFIAKRRGGELGFAAYVGGGMGARSRVGDLLEEFVSAGEAHLVAEAVKRVFDKHGNRKDKYKARLRFLVEQTLMEGFRKLYEEELAGLRRAAAPLPRLRDVPRRSLQPEPNGEPPRLGFDLWRRTNVSAQKQDGYFMVDIALLLGDIPADKLEGLAGAVGHHGERLLRTTQRQNFVIRWVHEGELAGLHCRLSALGLAETTAPVLRNMVACTGASTCRLGICLARGLASALARELKRSGMDLDRLGDFNIHINGCPNACGRHPIGDIGLFGAARREQGRLMPCYIVQLGGRVGETDTRLAEGQQSVPARNVPAFIVQFLKAFLESLQYPDYAAFLQAGGREKAENLSAAHKHVPAFEEDKNYYYDWGAETVFSLAGRGSGECGAGAFDLIEVDLASAHEALREGRLLEAAVLSAKALLITQGQEARDDAEALELFTKHFLDAGLVDESLRGVVEAARGHAQVGGSQVPFDARADEVHGLVSAVQALYDHMDPSLRFQPVARPPAPQPAAPGQAEARADREADFRGVVCPLNYVKTKLLLEQMDSGQVLSVLLDEPGARNVPQSVKQDGHKILSVKQEGNLWRVLVRRS